MGLWGMIAAGVGAVVGVVVAIYCPPAGAAITAACVAVVVAGANVADAQMDKKAAEGKKEANEQAKDMKEADARLKKDAGSFGASVDGDGTPTVDAEAANATPSAPSSAPAAA